MKRFYFYLVLSFSPVFISYSQVATTEVSDDLKFSADVIEKHMEYLASDVFEGRGTGTTGGSLAAKYIALEYSKYGLIPIGDNESYYHNIPMHGSYPLKSSELKIYSDNEEKSLQLEDDYLLYKSGQQTFTPIPLQLVFVGYGIIAPEFDYNDYQSVNVEGKIVVFLEGEPESDDVDFFDGEVPTVYSYIASKQRIAVSRGAAGSILIPDEDNIDWQKTISDFAFEDVSLAYSSSNNLSLLINPESVDYLFQNSDITYDQIKIMKDENRLTSFNMATKLTFKGEYVQRDFISQNIAGMIEGSDPDLKDRYVIVSAHYDHLGIGPSVEGDSIYNGALDNAIGVAVLLELAKQFTELENTPKKSLIFLALTGEEKGLLGSTYYTDNPLVPLYKTIANVNIDGIALFKDFQSIIGIGSEYSTLEDFLYQTAQSFEMSIDTIPDEFNKFEAFNQSDQLSFARAGIPSILILEGLKNKHKSRDEVIQSFIDYIENRYHKPNDDLSKEIDFLAAAQHAQFLFGLLKDVLNSAEEPEWKTGSPYVNERLRSEAEKR